MTSTTLQIFALMLQIFALTLQISIRRGGCGKFACKRYKLDKNLKLFKFVRVHSDSPESDLKNYNDEQIKRETTDNLHHS